MLTPPASSTTTNTNYYTNLPTTSASRNLTAEDLLIESLGGIDNVENRRWAQQLLARYDFPPNSFHSPLEFARHYIEWEQIPLWAERYKILPYEIPPIETRVLDKAGNYHTLCYFANHTINAGCDGEVYQDHDENYVIKKYYEKYDCQRDSDIVSISDSDIKSIEKSTAFFCHYYGENTAKIYHDDEQNLFVRMKKIAGKPLSQVDSFPAEAIKKFNHMLTELTGKNIFHSDLQKNNILWDSETGKFNPIDFGNDPRNLSKLSQEDLSDALQNYAKDCIEFIMQKIEPPPPGPNLFWP